MAKKHSKKAPKVSSEPVQEQLPADEPAEIEAKSSMVDSVKQAGASVVESLKNPQQIVESVRESVNNAADALDRTLVAVKNALLNADEKVAKAQEWTAEKVERLESTLTTLRETVAAAGQLVDVTQSRARSLSDSADQVLRGGAAAAQNAVTQPVGAAATASGAAPLVAHDEELAPETGTPIEADADFAGTGPDAGARVDSIGGIDASLDHDDEELEGDVKPDRGNPRDGGTGLL